MKKRIFIILLLCLLIWTVSGCGRTFWVNYLFASDDKEFTEILEDFLQAADKNDPQNIGIQIMDLATKQAFDDRYFLWHSESGIYKQEIACEDYRCMIISGNRREYKAVDRELSVDYFRDFIQKSTDYGELLNEIGKPNGELLKDEYVFEITQSAAEKMYAVLSVSGNEIMMLEIVNEEKVIDKIYERNAK